MTEHSSIFKPKPTVRVITTAKEVAELIDAEKGEVGMTNEEIAEWRAKADAWGRWEKNSPSPAKMHEILDALEEARRDASKWEIRAETVSQAATAKVDELTQLAETAEADQQKAQSRMWDLNKRAEKAEARAKELETFNEAMLQKRIDECLKEMAPFEGLQPFAAILKGHATDA